MTKGFRQSQSTLHTWSGLLLGWVLFAVFVSGTAAYWREALNRWSRPELAQIEDPDRVVRGAVRFLEKHAPDAQSWFIQVPTNRSAGAEVFWRPQPNDDQAPSGRRETSALIGANGQSVTTRETRGGELFYRFHFDLHYMPTVWGRWLVGVATMFMLVAILSGIVTHKKIFKDFFTLRRAKGQRSWLDGHNAAAVLALPFHLMITYTGLVTLFFLYMPWASMANYTDKVMVFDDLFPKLETAERTGQPTRLVDLVPVIDDGEQRLGAPIGNILVSEPGDAAARITLSQSNASMLSSRTPDLTYDGTNGSLLWRSPPLGGATITQGAMVGLHTGRFADYSIRWLYFLCGIAGSLMVASGLILWVVKRRNKLPDPDLPHFGFRLVERLNIGFIAGFPIGMVSFLWANRLLPTQMVARAEWEIHVMFICWSMVLVYAFFRRPLRAWLELLGLLSLALLTLPIFNLLATPAGLNATIGAGDWVLAGTDLTLAALGGGFGFAAWRVAQFRPKIRATCARDAQVVVGADTSELVSAK